MTVDVLLLAPVVLVFLLSGFGEGSVWAVGTTLGRLLGLVPLWTSRSTQPLARRAVAAGRDC